ncbi:MAG: RsiV family protein [Steroidobacteraceae bacterium]
MHTRSSWALLPLLGLLASCQRAEVDLPRTVAPEPVKVTASANGFEGVITIDGGIVSVPRLHELIEPRMRGSMAETQVAAQMDARARGVATAEGYFFQADWTSRPAGGRYLDVRGQVSTYAGGAHPMTTVEAFVWDLLGQRRLALADLLKEPAPGSPAVVALAGAARAAIIAVKRARAPGYDPAKDTFIGTGGDGPFAPDLAKFARNFQLLPRAADGSGGGVEFLYSPYDVGPYSDGAYAVTVPAPIVAPLLKPDAARVLE